MLKSTIPLLLLATTMLLIISCHVCAFNFKHNASGSKLSAPAPSNNIMSASPAAHPSVKTIPNNPSSKLVIRGSASRLGSSFHDSIDTLWTSFKVISLTLYKVEMYVCMYSSYAQSKFKKSYTSATDSTRKAQFRKTDEMIQRHNSQNPIAPFTLAHNFFSDLV